MTTGQASLFEQQGEHAAASPSLVHARRPREEFLTGLLATWLAGVGSKATKEQREQAAAVARHALEELAG